VPARAFLTAISHGELLQGWRYTDPQLREYWAFRWLFADARHVEHGSWDVAAVMDAFQADRPDHPLWEAFERDVVQTFRDWGLTTDRSAVSEPGAFGPDTEVVYLLPPDGDDFAAQPTQAFLVFVMRYDCEYGWRVLSPFSGDAVLEPVWQPAVARRP